MNFMTQMCEQNMGFAQPVNFHLRPDHFQTESLTPDVKRRHTLVGSGSGDDTGSGFRSRSNSHQRRPSSVYAGHIQLNDLSTANSVSRSSILTRIHSRRQSMAVHDETLQQLLAESEPPSPQLPGKPSEYLIPRCEESLSSDHDCALEGCQRVTINVSGLRFETQLRTLDRLPHTLLGDPEKRRHFWDEARQEFFFDRHRPTFQAVLYYYQSGGRLKRPLEVPMDIFLNELHFYELGGSAIDSFKQNEGYIVDKPPLAGPQNELLKKIWTTVEYPESSILAKVFAVLSVSFILISVVTFCVETLPELKESDCKNVTVLDEHGNSVWKTVPNLTGALFLTETCCIAWFVLELLLRFISSPSKIIFLRSAINWIDLIAITPYFIFLIINTLSGSCDGDNKGSVLSVLRVLRVVRILKLSKHSEGLKILGMTLKTSIRELSMFLLFMAIATVIFSGAIFYAELDHPNTQFSSIPDAFWWCIVTMTTVGYGDFVPMGLFGKILGGVTVLSGVLAIALPVPVIVANFNNYYRHYTEESNRGRAQACSLRDYLPDLPCRRCVTCDSYDKDEA